MLRGYSRLRVDHLWQKILLKPHFTFPHHARRDEFHCSLLMHFCECDNNAFTAFIITQ